MKENVVIVSLGQLVASDINTSINAFAKACSNAGYYLAGSRVRVALLDDQMRVGTIDAYKKGEIDWDTFKQRITSQLGMEISDEAFEQAWNAMCKISKPMIEELKALAILQKEKGLDIVIASATNEKQFEYIQRLFHKNEIVFDAEKTFYGLSYEKRTLNNQELAWGALEEKGLQDKEILSLHNAIAIGTQHGVDTQKDSLVETICNELNFDLPVGYSQGKFVQRLEKQRQGQSGWCQIL